MTQLAEPPSPKEDLPSGLEIPADLTASEFRAAARQVGDWERLRRFLVLGREDGSYRAASTSFSLESAHSVFGCLVADGPRAVRTIVEVVEAGVTAGPEPVLFVLALAAADRAAGQTRAAALAALPRVCRTGAQLLHFARYVDDLRGWGRGLRRAVAAWYRQPADWLAREVVAVREHAGWTHRDLLRLAHPQAPSEAHQELFRWIVRGWDELPIEERPELRPLFGSERVRRATTREDVVALVREYGVAPQSVPAVWLQDRQVWSVLVEQMSTPDLLQNLEVMAGAGLLSGQNELSTAVAAHLSDQRRVLRSRVQPFEVLAARRVCLLESRSAARGAAPAIIEALESGFHHALANVAATGMRWLLALDVSGSTGRGKIAGLSGLSPREGAAAAALALTTAEQQATLLAFAPGSCGPGGRWGGEVQLAPVELPPDMRLVDVVRRLERLPMGGVDCALPMQWALWKKLPVDVFAIFTDAETWSGRVTPAPALREYRERMGIAAKLVVVGLSSDGFKIADPLDGGMLDVVGFDVATPGLIADFVSR